MLKRSDDPCYLYSFPLWDKDKCVYTYAPVHYYFCCLIALKFLDYLFSNTSENRFCITFVYWLRNYVMLSQTVVLFLGTLHVYYQMTHLHDCKYDFVEIRLFGEQTFSTSQYVISFPCNRDLVNFMWNVRVDREKKKPAPVAPRISEQHERCKTQRRFFQWSEQIKQKDEIGTHVVVWRF